MTDKSNTVFHSALSPLINLGLIAPEEILDKLRKIENKVPMNSLEGYIRPVSYTHLTLPTSYAV